jgi:hypothetical protein
MKQWISMRVYSKLALHRLVEASVVLKADAAKPLSAPPSYLERLHAIRMGSR